MSSPLPKPRNFQIGIICPDPTERAAVVETLDEEYESPPEKFPNDPNDYALGRIGKHYVVISGLPGEKSGTDSASKVAANLMRTFTSVTVLLLVGIGGGVPSIDHDIRLGDVVVSQPTGTHGGVVYYNFEKAQEGGIFEPTGYLSPPPLAVLSVLSKLQTEQIRGRTNLPTSIPESQGKQEFSYVGPDNDLVFEVGYEHQKSVDCESCDSAKLIQRNPQTPSFVSDVPGPHIHYGLIASADQLVKDCGLRDTLNHSYGGQILCFEMEAAGLMESFPCLVIRGISDYCDSHNNRADKAWHGCAAAMAAAYAKELILELPLEKLAKDTLPSDAVKIEAERMRAKEAADCLSALFLTNPSDDRAGLLQKKGSIVPGTCEWIKNNPLYESWIVSDSQLLWFSGGPGKGKTMLAIFLAEEIEQWVKHSPDALFIQFFCENGDKRRNTAVAILRGLIFQLLHLRPKLYDHILPSFRLQKKSLFTDSSFETLWGIFENMTRDPVLGTTYCIIDGLDECDGASSELLLRKIRALFLTKVSESPACDLNLIILSRDLPHFIPEILSGSPRIQLDSDVDHEVNNDIRHFIEVKVDELSASRTYPDQLRRHVTDVFRSRAKGTFLWVGIVAKELSKYKVAEVEAALELFPPGLEGLYPSMLLQIDVSRRKIAAQIFRWVVMAIRPLTLSELGEVIETADRPPVGFSRDDLIRSQISHCGYFLTVKGFEVHLIHKSAKDYLLRRSPESNSDLEIFRVKEDTANLEIARKCLDYLQNGALAGGAVYLGGYDSFTTAHLEAFPLLSYAALHWPDHARSLATPEDIFDLSFPFYNKKSLVREFWLKTYWFSQDYTSPPNSFSLLHLASYFGMVPLAQNLLFKKKKTLISKLKFYTGIYVNEKDGSGNTALHWAAGRGHKEVVQLLLDATADMNARNESGRTALHEAAWHGQQAMVWLLLEVNADINARDENGWTALCTAADRGYEKVMHILLDANADVNATDKSGKTVLHKAAHKGHMGMVKLLIEAKADINAKDLGSETVLYSAATGGNEAVVQLLIEANADVNVKNKLGGTVLYWAAHRGDEKVAQLLLEARADVDAKDEHGKTALHMAALHRHEVMVWLLLEANADVNARDENGWTALCTAADRGYETIVHLLLDAKADINAKNNDGQTALYLATKGGHKAIVQLLLQANVDINAKDKYGKTALHIAVWRRVRAVVQLLIDANININTGDERGRTALHEAAWDGDEAMVQMLLSAHADINAKDKQGRSALDWATQLRHKAVVRRLQSATNLLTPPGSK